MELARRALVAELMERPAFDSPQSVRDYLRLQLADLNHEVFAVMFLDAQHRLIAYEPMFRGTLTQTSCLSARSPQARAGAQRCRADPGAQPPVGRGRAVAR